MSLDISDSIWVWMHSWIFLSLATYPWEFRDPKYPATSPTKISLVLLVASYKPLISFFWINFLHRSSSNFPNKFCSIGLFDCKFPKIS